MPQLCGDWAQQLAPRRIGRYHGAETIWEPSFERMTEIARDLAAKREARGGDCPCPSEPGGGSSMNRRALLAGAAAVTAAVAKPVLALAELEPCTEELSTLGDFVGGDVEPPHDVYVWGAGCGARPR